MSDVEQPETPVGAPSTEVEAAPVAGEAAGTSPVDGAVEPVMADAVPETPREAVPDAPGEDAPEYEVPPRLDSEQVKAIVEALIFASPEPLTPKMLFKLLSDEPKEDVMAAVEAVR